MTRDVAMIMAGGTGGHVFPALATARVLERRGFSIVWLGTQRGIESRLVPAAGIPVEWLSVSGLRGKGLGTLLVAAILAVPAAASRLLTRRAGPMMVVAVAVAVLSGFAGIYASFHLKTAAGASVVIAIAACYLLAALVGWLRTISAGGGASPTPARGAPSAAEVAR